MARLFILMAGVIFMTTLAQAAANQFETDLLPTTDGDLQITFLGHGTLMFVYNGLVIHVDPYSQVADYTQLPKADLILITHEHPDHFDLKALQPIRKEGTLIVLTATCAARLNGGIIMRNGDEKTVAGLEIKAVPAYNIVSKRPDGSPFHPRGVGNGYLIRFGDKRVYVAGDTENTPEMKALRDIDCAFLPMNQPYTMTPAMVADAAKAFTPRILYPYHFGDTPTAELEKLLADCPHIEVRIRKMP